MSNMFLLKTGSKKDNLLLTWPKTACVKVLSDFLKDEKEPVRRSASLKPKPHLSLTVRGISASSCQGA